MARCRQELLCDSIRMFPNHIDTSRRKVHIDIRRIAKKFFKFRTVPAFPLPHLWKF